MFIPYRAKNPPERFPSVTITLIVTNIVLYLLTSHHLLFIRDDVVYRGGVSHQTLSLGRLTTAMFLHGNPLHLAANMLFLWVFGASVEGRLRPVKFLLLYLCAGYVGGLLHDRMFGLADPLRYSLGASGAVMGLAGAYLYSFPYSTICTFCGVRFAGRSTIELQARWVVLLYVGMDILNAYLYKGADGVGHWAHLGGFGMGLLMAFLFQAERDSANVSSVQAIRADVKDYDLLSFAALETLIEEGKDDIALLLAYCEKAALFGASCERCFALLNRYSRRLLPEADPNRLARIVLHIPPECGGMPSAFLMRLAARLERIASNDLACQLYQRVYDLAPTAPDTEMALYRLALLRERMFDDCAHARAAYGEILRLFPNGHTAIEARRALQQ